MPKTPAKTTKKPVKKKVAAAEKGVRFVEAQHVPIGNVVPNTYNPNKMNPSRFEAFCQFVDRVGFLHPIAVSPADKQGMHTIIDGEHRYEYLKSRGAKTIPVVIMPKDFDGRGVDSMLASLQFNIHGENDGIKLGEVYQVALDNNYDAQTLAGVLGEAASDIERITSLLNIDYGSGRNEPPDDPDDEGSDEFVTIEFAIPKVAWKNIIEPEIKRVMEVAGISHPTDEAIEFGQALELMATLSSQTPEESLT